MGNDLATVIGNFKASLLETRKLSANKLRTLDALQKCRTPYMGGHVEACGCCGELRIAHNSCRNRHCPQCGGIEKEKWILGREADLLPSKYFHVVFTVPDKLNKLFMENQPQMYNALFLVAWDVLSDFGDTKRWIGGRIGATAILHTWGQNLHYHPHLHFIVPAGALMPNDKWKQSRSRGKYLFYVKQLSPVFRARLVAKIRALIASGDVGGSLPKGLFAEKWVVYAKRPFGGPRKVINYLGRYTHRTAISNKRILEVGDKSVTFTWNNYANNYKREVTTIAGEEFLRLFCMHILPPGYVRIRHYGFLSSASKRRSLGKIRAALKVKPPPRKTKEELKQAAFDKMGIRPGGCKSCGGEMLVVQVLPNKFKPKKRLRAPPAANTMQPNESFGK